MGNERLDLDEQRPRALKHGRHHAAGRWLVVLCKEGARGISHLGQPTLAHLEDAHLLGGAKPVLGRAEQAQPAGPVALNREHHVHKVLQCLGASERPILGHVAHKDYRDPFTLRKLHEAQRDLAHLAHASRRAIKLLRGDRLHGIHDHERGQLGPREVCNPAHACLSHDADCLARPPAREPQTGCPKPHLTR